MKSKSTHVPSLFCTAQLLRPPTAVSSPCLGRNTWYHFFFLCQSYTFDSNRSHDCKYTSLSEFQFLLCFSFSVRNPTMLSGKVSNLGQLRAHQLRTWWGPFDLIDDDACWRWPDKAMTHGPCNEHGTLRECVVVAMGQPPANKSLPQWTALASVHGHCTASMIENAISRRVLQRVTRWGPAY
jgi:hypothetical protein